VRSLALAVLVACTPAAHEAAAPPTIRAGTSGDYAPFSTMEGDRPVGFAPALVSSFAAANGATATFTRFRWPSLSSDLSAHTFDVAADGITVRPERSMLGVFTVPIARGGAMLLLRRPSWATGLGGPTPRDVLAAIDRRELRIVVNRGGHLEHVALSLLHAAEVRSIADNSAVHDAFARGEADAAMTNTFEAPRWSAGLAGVEAIGPLSSDITALWVSADHEDLAARLDAWLLEEEDSGRLGALRAQWLGPGGEATARPTDALLAATAERLALMPFVAAAKRAAGAPVDDRVREARLLDAVWLDVERAAAIARTTPPSHDRVDAFFHAQFEAAKDVQRRAPSSSSSFSLDHLRPAITRITLRMAFLVARLPRMNAQGDLARRAHDFLDDSGASRESIDAVASTLADCSRP
jgi:cyclohexadienyl dehydratase